MDKLLNIEGRKHCFMACSKEVVDAGRCDCINQMKNLAYSQTLVRCSLFIGTLNEAHAKCERCGKEEWQHK